MSTGTCDLFAWAGVCALVTSGILGIDLSSSPVT